MCIRDSAVDMGAESEVEKMVDILAADTGIKLPIAPASGEEDGGGDPSVGGITVLDIALAHQRTRIIKLFLDQNLYCR